MRLQAAYKEGGDPRGSPAHLCRRCLIRPLAVTGRDEPPEPLFRRLDPLQEQLQSLLAPYNWISTNK